MQARENDLQIRYGKVWDKVLSDYGKGLIGLEMCGDGLLYAFGNQRRLLRDIYVAF